jgi:hypothetical protein
VTIESSVDRRAIKAEARRMVRRMYSRGRNDPVKHTRDRAISSNEEQSENG